MRREDIHYFAIHPGGRKILETIEQALDLSHDDNRFAYRVLRDYGNMSSATVLFVLRDMLAAATPADHGAPVLSFAFGPGLTLEAMLLEIVIAKPQAAVNTQIANHLAERAPAAALAPVA